MPQSSRRDRHPKPERGSNREAREPGAWLPWLTVEKICRLNLRPPSVWQVFLAVLLTSARYGGREARLEVADLVRMTGLGERTVQEALARLRRRGLLVREGRYGRLKVQLEEIPQPSRSADIPAPPGAVSDSAGGAGLSAPPTRTQACASPTCLYVSSNNDVCREGAFTASQRKLITDVLAESSELLGSEATELSLPPDHAQRLGLPGGVTYGHAYHLISESHDTKKARDFTRAVLALRSDSRVQGEELDLGDSPARNHTSGRSIRDVNR